MGPDGRFSLFSDIDFLLNISSFHSLSHTLTNLGHTCSLFPSHPLLSSKLLVASITDSPKPPSCRITLTLNIVNKARNVVFVAVGSSKAKVLGQMIRGEGDELPSAMVKVNGDGLVWMVDEEAAALI